MDNVSEDETFTLCDFAKKVMLLLALAMKEPRRVDVNGSFCSRPFRNNLYVSWNLQELVFLESDKKKNDLNQFLNNSF